MNNVFLFQEDLFHGHLWKSSVRDGTIKAFRLLE